MGDEANGTTTGATPGSAATAGQAGQGAGSASATPAGTGSGTEGATPADALGDTGKDILRDARRAARDAEDRAKAAEAELQKLQEGQATEHDKALSQARREATAESNAKWVDWGRDVIVEAALRQAGITSDKLISLAKAAPELRDLKFDTDTRKVEGVSEAVAKLKTDGDYAALFGEKTAPPEPPQGGAWGGSQGGSNAAPVEPGLPTLRRAYETSSKP